MTKEEDFFKENFPEYVTEKGEFLSPYWDLFNAGVICATFESKVKIEQLEKENAELKEVHESDKRSLALIAKKGADFEKTYNETEELLDKQIEATYKVVEELTKAKEIIKKFSEFVNNEVEYDPEHPQEHTDLWNKLCERAEEFLKEGE